MGACSASLGAPYVCVSPPGFLLGELQACALPVPARKLVRAEVGGVGGPSPGWDMGGPQLAAHPLLALGDQVTQVRSGKPGLMRGCSPSGGRPGSHTQRYLIR